MEPSDRPSAPATEIREYEAAGIVVTWEARRCQHAAECVRGLPQVFDRDRRPWIHPGDAQVENIVNVIDRCPSFALGYRVDDGRARTAPASAPPRE
jgi:uncharacterized Fe-S cluster protein YjdI